MSSTAPMAFSQINLDWVTRYNGTGDSIDVATAIAVDDNGNVYVTGYSSGLLGLTDYTTIKYDPNGNQLWVARYDGTGLLNDEARAIAVDDSGNVYVTGMSFGLLSLSLSDYATIKYDSNGNELWVQRYNGILLGDDAATDIALDGNGGVIVTGYSSGLLSGNDYTTIKYNAGGNEQWVRKYNGPGNNTDKAYAIVVDNNNNIIITGESKSGLLENSYDYATVKYDANGNEQWVRRYNGPGNNTDKAYAIVVDSGGSVYVTGEARSSGSGTDYGTVKYDQNGNQQWARTYSGPGNNTDKAYAIVVDNNNNPVVTGESTSSSSGEDYATVKYDQNGNEQWAQRYNGPGNNTDKAYAIVVDNNNNIIVTGSSDSIGTADDYTTVSYDSSGTRQWVTRYNGPGNSSDKAYAIVVDNNNNVIITGGSRSGLLLESEDYATIKYSQKTNITGISGQIPFGYVMKQNYPNPFNPSTNIEFSVPRVSSVKIAIYNYLGVQIDEFNYSSLNSGTYVTNWNAGNRASGIYLYKIIISDQNSGNTLFQEVKKMTLIK